MRLSILLPTHNRSNVLRFAIESVLAQTFTDFELLVVGDGCTDNTAEVVEHYAAQDVRVRWFDLPKASGFGYANRNVVLRQATGELIGFMAHDDIVTPDHFQRLVEMMDDVSIYLAHSSAVWVANNGDMVPTVFNLEDPVMKQGLLDNVWNRLPATCFMHRREAFSNVGFWDATLPKGGDMDLWGRIIRHYGLQSVRGTSLITAFHFRAIWRTQEYINPDNEPPWLRLHGEPERLSSWLKLPIPPGQTEQEALSVWLRAHPEAIDEIRNACVHALMTHAWELEKSTSGNAVYIQQLEKKIAESSSSEEAFKREISALEQERVELLRAKNAFEEAHTAALQRIRSLEERSKDLTQQRDELKAERDRLKEKMRSLSDEAERLKNRRWWNLLK